MSTNKINLTTDRIRKAPIPDKGRIYLYDNKVQGLRVQITKTGTQSFQFYCWVKGHGPFTYTIGRFPKVSIPAARKKAQFIAGEIAVKGSKAIKELKQEPLNDQRFSELFEKWFKMAESRGDRDLKNLRSRYENHISPTLGNKRIQSLTDDYIKGWFANLKNRKKARGKGNISPTTANRILEIVQAVFNSRSGEHNPAAKIKSYHEVSRERYLSAAELKRLFEALDEPKTPTDLRHLVLLALTTGARKMNLLSMRWSDLDLDAGIWFIPASISKNKKPMTIPLIAEAVEILAGRKKVGAFVFPAKSKTGHIVDVRKMWAELLKRAEIEEFVFHDLRRTAGSWQALTGASDLIIAKSLGHKSTASTRVYARIRDSNPVRDSMSTGYAAMRAAAKRKKGGDIG